MSLTPILILGGMLTDGSGAPPFRADIRLSQGIIQEIGQLKRRKGETVIHANGKVVTPGFVDAHSHADFGIADEPGALSQITQGVTTAVVGVDGIWSQPVRAEMAKLEAVRPAISFALFSGHGGVRARVLGGDYKRPASQAELITMGALVREDMADGALGLSSGLEYDPGYYASTEELIELARAARGGLYISHMRDEGNRAEPAIQELIRIGREAHVPAQISHIKLCTKPVWGQAAGVVAQMKAAGATADLYPYTFWQSSLSALTPSRDWGSRKVWEDALKDVGGASHVRITACSSHPAWEGRILSEIAERENRDAIGIIQEILQKTHAPGQEGRESCAVEAMTERDLSVFLRAPMVMFSSDGAIGGSHPRGAGSFPRVLARYVRERKLISLPEAIRKMTSLPCKVLKLGKRGLLRKGYAADVLVFDPKAIQDHATAQNPHALSTGMDTVIVGGVLELRRGRPTGLRGGSIVRRMSP